LWDIPYWYKPELDLNPGLQEPCGACTHGRYPNCSTLEKDGCEVADKIFFATMHEAQGLAEGCLAEGPSQISPNCPNREIFTAIAEMEV
jgi:hypothetical protein